MPGIFGIIDTDHCSTAEHAPAPLLASMAERLAHVDGERVETWSDARRGMHLGRIGLPHVNPVAWPAEEDRLKFFVAGSLLNAPSLDPAPEPADLAEAASRLRGFFAAVIDDGARTLLVADRHASLPFYYAQLGTALLFAPETKALLCHTALSRELDQRALASFVVSGFLPGELTLLAGVKRLRGGEAIIVEQGQARRIEYWRYRPASRVGKASRRDLEETLGGLVEQATARHLGDPEKTVLFLSGGFDSRAILGAAARAMGGDVARLQTVTWGQDRGPDDSDVAVAENLAATLGLRHEFIQRRTADYEHRVREVNALVDAQSEIAVFHPHEHAIMKELRGRGFERVLRGDECFGYSYHVRSLTGALAVVWMHRLADAVNGRDFLRPEAHRELCAASDAVIDATLAEVAGMSPDDAKDYFYFAHRLQGYLNTASYYKRCLLDQRNVFLDEAFLDFLELVPARWRIDKNLFCAAVRRRFPDLYRLPMARRHNLEDWAALLRQPTPVRAWALKELADGDSGIWRWFDRDACLRYVEGLPSRQGETRRRGVKSWLVPLFLRLPRWLQAPVQAWKASRPAFRLASEYVLLRALALKDWHDRAVQAR